MLDPFAGGGAIPLEAMRLGCEVTANDLNPVAWFILKCTLEYPQKLAGQTRPLPDFALQDRDFMAAFLKAKGYKGAALRRELAKLNSDAAGGVAEPELLAHRPLLEADLAWQVRAWGRWVLAQARKRLARRYPTYAEWTGEVVSGQGSVASGEAGGRRLVESAPFDHSPLEGESARQGRSPQSSRWGGDARPAPDDEPFERLRRLEPDADGKTDAGPLNAGFDKTYLDDPRNPRWIAKPTVAYLWARTVRCKGCRAILPLLKTKWLAKKDNKRVLLTVTPNTDRTGVVFGIETDVPQVGGNAAQRRAHDQRRGAGSMSRSGAQCPCCPTIMSMDDIRYEGRAGRLGAIMTTVVVDGVKGKEYRLPTDVELRAAEVSKEELDEIYEQIPFGLPEEPLPPIGTLGFRVQRYGFDQWAKLFAQRQLLIIGTMLLGLRTLDQCIQEKDISLSVQCALICAINRLTDINSNISSWINKLEAVRNTFARFALPIVWDFAEANPIAETTGSFGNALEWVARVYDHLLISNPERNLSQVENLSATDVRGEFDCIVTDPPYYDAIPYSDLMDFFQVWLHRSTRGLSSEIDAAFQKPLGPKWDHNIGDGELIDDASRFDGDKALSKRNYEDGMARAFQACHAALQPDGRLVVVFANKSPDAWRHWLPL